MTDVREHFDRPVLATSLAKSCSVEQRLLGDPRPASWKKSARQLNLNRTIQNKVIPSLVLAHARSHDPPLNSATQVADPVSNDAATLAEQMLAGDIKAAFAKIETLRAEGHALEIIYLRLLAPAAVHLRQLWHNDLCGFAEATLALWRLQQVLREYSTEFRSLGERHDTELRALLAPTPREKHDLSYAMFCSVLLSEFFRRDGWEVWIEPDSASREFDQIVREQWFDVVEFLVSGDKQLDSLAARIRTIRRESPNRSIGVMVYGRVFIEHPELVLQVGADLTAADARQGAMQAQNLVGLTNRS